MTRRKRRSNMALDKEQYFLLNVAMGGSLGAIPSSFTQASMDIDYVRVYQNTLIDTEGPTNLQLPGRLLVLQWSYF
jgi:beta-glucanase (GH16 family)